MRALRSLENSTTGCPKRGRARQVRTGALRDRSASRWNWRGVRGFLFAGTQERTKRMKHQFMLAAAACFTLATGTAAADCAAEIAALSDGIAKDGSHAPLAAPATPETGSDAAAADTSSAESEGEVAKDGSTAPLGADAALAT